MVSRCLLFAADRAEHAEAGVSAAGILKHSMYRSTLSRPAQGCRSVREEGPFLERGREALGGSRPTLHNWRSCTPGRSLTGFDR